MAAPRGLPPQFKSVDECHNAMVRHSRGAVWQAALGVALLYLAYRLSPWLLGSADGVLGGDVLFLLLLGLGGLSMLSGSVKRWRKLAAIGRQLEDASRMAPKNSYTRREPSLRRY